MQKFDLVILGSGSTAFAAGLRAAELGKSVALTESLITIGGGYISSELGQLVAGLGCKVTIIERGVRILSRFEPEISESVRQAFRNEGIAVVVNARITAVQGDARMVPMHLVPLAGAVRDTPGGYQDGGGPPNPKGAGCFHARSECRGGHT